MVPKFKYYFYPFLNNLIIHNSCRLFDLAIYISQDLKLTKKDLAALTKGGKVTKHSSRVNYCASYLKRMGLVETFSPGAYKITSKGIEVLNKYGKDLTLENLRELPEYILTQVKSEISGNSDLVYVKSHRRGNKIISPYICNKKFLNTKNPHIENIVSESFKEKSSD